MSSAVCNDHDILNAIEAVSGAKAKGQQRDSLRFYPFPARMPLLLGRHLIDETTTAEAVVLDPMAGSGTTLIAARQLGRRGWGFDRDPLAVLVAGSAVQDFESSRLHRLKARILHRAEKINIKKQARLKEQLDRLPVEDRDFIDFWFPEKSQIQLLALRQSIDEENEGPEHNLAWTIFSSLIIAKRLGRPMPWIFLVLVRRNDWKRRL